MGDLATAWQAEFDRLGFTALVRSPGEQHAHRMADVAAGDRVAEVLLVDKPHPVRLACVAGTMPGHAGVSPDHAGVSLDHAGPAPDHAGRAPDRAGVSPDRAGLAPGHAGASPDRAGAAPDRERRLLYGYLPDLAEAATVARQWLSGARPAGIAAAWPYFGSAAQAEARERGDRHEVSWLSRLDNHLCLRGADRLKPFLELAAAEPRLRALTLHTSHWMLSFSESPRWPFTDDYPWVAPASTQGRYVVHRNGRAHAETDAAGALRDVLSELP